MENEKTGWGGTRRNAGLKPQGDQPKANHTLTLDQGLVARAREEARRLGFLRRGEPNLSAYTEHLYREAQAAQEDQTAQENRKG